MKRSLEEIRSERAQLQLRQRELDDRFKGLWREEQDALLVRPCECGRGGKVKITPCFGSWLGNGFMVFCESCHAMIEGEKTIELAADAWNVGLTYILRREDD